MLRRSLPILVAAATAAASGCGGRPETPLLLAAASLARVVPDLLDEADLHARISCAASSTLARQIVQGQRADVFLSADERWVDYLIERGHGKEKRRLARNRLVAWVVKGAPAPATPSDLKDPGWGRIAVGAEQVPVGRYAREALAGIDLGEERLLPCRDARRVMAALSSGEAGVAIAYATDGTGLFRAAFRFERPVASCWALLCDERPQARELFDGLGNGAVFRRHGFE